MDPFTTLCLKHPYPGVVEVVMSRESVHNAFDETMIAELDAAFTQLDIDDSVRLIVLSGEGDHFSAGADVTWMQRASAASTEWNLADARRFAEMLGKVALCRKPTLARVQGAAIGGGVGLVAACDIAIAADSAVFAVSEARLGILPAVIGPHLVNAVGRRQAQRLALTAQRFTAQQALDLGLVHEVVPLAQFDRRAQATVNELLQAGPMAQREIKDYFARLAVGPVDETTREFSAQTIARVRATEEARAGLEAFLAKRPAPWAR